MPIEPTLKCNLGHESEALATKTMARMPFLALSSSKPSNGSHPSIPRGLLSFGLSLLSFHVTSSLTFLPKTLYTSLTRFALAKFNGNSRVSIDFVSKTNFKFLVKPSLPITHYAMEVLNASIVKPIPKKLSPFKSPKPPSLPSVKPPSLEQVLPRGLAISLSTVTTTLFSNNFAKSLTYEEALGQTTTSDDSFTNVIDGIVQFATENQLIIGGAALALIVPLILSQILQKPKSFGVVSAKSAYAKLSEESEAQLLDIREGKDIKLVGSPDIKATKKKAVSVTYKGDDKQGFLKKIGLRFKDPENTTLFILDKFDGNSELVAELVTANGFKAAYAIKDGAEGPRGWQSSGLPWTEPKKGFALDFSEIKDAFSVVFGTTDGLPVTVGLAVVTGLGALALTEIETVLQLLGSLAIIQFASNKLLSAEDRKKTVQQLDEFLTTKVAPEELVDDIKMIGKALLPESSDKKSLPAPAATTPVAEAPAATTPVAEAPAATTPVAETPAATTPVAETPAATTPVAETPPATSPVAETPPAPAEETDVVFNFNSSAETKTEVKEEIPPTATSTPVQVNATPSTPRPLSPYPYYPDFKPPSSPSPSQP